MKKTWFLCIFLFIYSYAFTQDSVESDLRHFLNSRPTIIKTGLYNSQDDELLIVLMPDKYTKEGFVVTQKNGVYKIYLIIKGSMIYDKDKVLIDVSSAPGQFTGWKIEISTNIRTNINTGLRFQWFANSGSSTTDAITLNWVEQEDRFEKYLIYKPQW